MANACEFRKKDGTICGANAQGGKPVCVFHDLARASDGRRARRAGGLTRSAPRVLPATTPVVQLNSCKDVAGVLAESINQVRRGELDPGVANAIGYLAGLLLKAHEQGAVEDRLLKIEDSLGLTEKESGKDEDDNS
jgi:hypothetical protein